MHRDLLNAWSKDNPNSDIPRLNYGDQYSNYTSDRFLTDGSWLALQSVSVNYTMPRKWVNALGLSSIRVGVSGDNLTYWSKRRGLDPRINSSGSISATKYAPARTIIGSVNIQF